MKSEHMKIICLSQDFYNDYSGCTEIEQKISRPYAQVYIVVNGLEFAIPFRSNINHPNVHWTDKVSKCGLDFSKAVVITKPQYIDRTIKPRIRPNEFNALRGRDYIVGQELMSYIRKYKKAKSRLDIPRNRILCLYSTMQYFEDHIKDI